MLRIHIEVYENLDKNPYDKKKKKKKTIVNN